MDMRTFAKRFLAMAMAFIMVTSSFPYNAFAASYDYDNLTGVQSKIINNETPVSPAKLKTGQTAEKLINNPVQPDIYTLRKDYKVQRGEKYAINYQPYIASVGAAATEDEQKKVDKTIDLPDLAGYEKPEDNYKITYGMVKNAAEGKGKTGNETNGIRYQANEDFRYKAKSNQIKIKHVFQDLEDFSKYTNPDGSVGETGELITTQNGNTGSTMEVSPLTEGHPNRAGFVPERKSIIMQVPENAENFILEYRYNRAHYDVVFDTAGGTALPARTLYYGQVMPKIADANIPTKVGGEFQGWKPSVDITTKDGKTYEAKKIIKDGTGSPIKNLDAKLIMPASKVTFTAVWKDKEKADYAVQFWAEKADHADGASLADKYDYIGTRVYKDQTTGSRPDLDNEPVKDIVFPDLDKARLAKIWANARFNRGKGLYLNKFYVYNQDLTHDQNKDPANVNLVKSVDATGKTVYNIYYDRQVYDLYFTKSNALSDSETFYPEIWKYDKEQGKAVMAGGPGNPYHYKARFNEMMYKWPNDAKQTKGFTPGYQSFGWGPNYSKPNFPIHLDTPPYRLNADEFLDMANYTNWGGYMKKIDKGNGTTKNLDTFDFTTLSFGIKQQEASIPHHMDFWMDGFKKGETIIRYDLVRTKADTDSLTYGHRYPIVEGFTPYGYDPMKAWPAIKEGSQKDGRVDEEGIDTLNDEREEITPNNSGTYYNNFGTKLPIGQLDFISAFFSNADEYGDPLDGEENAFKENGYLRFKYTRNKYPLRFNTDPTKIKDDSEFNSTNQLDTFYEFPLKALSPDADTEGSYNTENPKNILDNPEKLQGLNLTDLVFTDPKDGKLKVKRPDNLSDQMVFKGWALDPAGTKLIWENPKETMPTHPLNLYAKWGEPDYKWKVTFDPNGGSLRNIKEENLTTSRKKIQEGDIGQEEINTYAKKEKNDGDKQVFTVIQRQKLVEPKFKPTRKGYDFMGWEVIRYKKNAKGDYTDEIDTSYRDTYKVPELYSFGNDVVAPVYLKAIWVPNQRVDVKVEHYKLDKDYKLVEKLEDTLEDKRANYFVATIGDQQDDEYILAPHEELEEKLTGDLKTDYEAYNKRVGLNNTFFQTFRVEPAKIPDPNGSGNMIDNPKVRDNVFKFFYRPYRQREYKVNYIDERFKGKETEKGAAIIDQELVVNGNRHYDARNYRRIPGWVLAENEKPQQQLFFDVNEKTNAFKGINGTGKDEITFYYKDVRVIEVPKDGVTPDGYVRVTFKAEKGGSFGKDAEGKDITELNYDVIKGLKSDLLPVPKELAEGETVDANKHYITPETGKKFTKWDNKALLNKNTIINENHTFTAYFEWSGLSASGLVKTEAFKDPDNTWTNDFAPTIDQLKAKLLWREKDQVKDLPAGTEIKLYDEKGNELTSDDQVYNLVNEKKAADKDELVRTVNIKAKVTFKDGKEPQELTIPIMVYKNVYEALNKAGDKPLFLKEAEGKEAKDGGLKDVTGDYVMVTVKASKDFNAKDDKIYWVNKNAWVEIPEVKTKGSSTFVNWTSDKAAQNEGQAENGTFDFGKRHKFTENTVISPSDAKDVVEQTDPNTKPNVPNSYVKVIVKTTDKATTELTQTFWVNPTKEVTIPVTDPVGKENQKYTFDGLGEKDVNYIFKEWQKVQIGETDDNLTKVDPAVKTDLVKNRYTDKVTLIEAAYKKSIQAGKIEKPLKTTKLDTPQGKEITDEILKGKITPQEGKEIKSIQVINRPDPSRPGDQKATVIVTYTDGSTQGTDKDPVVIPVEVHKNIIPEAPGGQKPKDALENYVKVTFKAGTGGSVSGDLVYYVSPEVVVDMTESAGKVTKKAYIGYINGDWDTSETKKLKDTFKAETEFTFNFVKDKDIVEKTDDPNQVIPEGYVKVTFKTDGNGKVDGKDEKIYYVNPKADIKLGKETGDKILVVPTLTANENYVFKEWQEAIDEATPITSERIHVAIFKSGQVTLTYAKGGEDVTGDVPAPVTVNYGETVGLANKGTLEKPNHEFAGWKLDDDETIYQPGAQVKLEKVRTATAQWKPVNHTVTFDAKGGSKVDSQQVEHGKTATQPKAPKLDGKVFMGWKENASDENYFDFTTPIEADKTLVAQWEKSVQPIDEKDTVDKEHFIKVTFKQGDHGQLVPDKDKQDVKKETVTYKVAKNDNFEDAIKHGLVVPGIAPAKYYKVVEDKEGVQAKHGWDKELNLTLEADATEKVFTAQYEPIGDVIPVDPTVTDKTQIQNEKPKGMVLVEFKVPEAKAYMRGDTKFYVAKDKLVEITPPLVVKTDENYDFKGWGVDDVTKKVTRQFDKDTEINSDETGTPDIIVQVPRAGASLVEITKLTDGATGHLVLTRNGQEYEFTSGQMIKKTKVRRKIVKKQITCFDLSTQSLTLQANDKISVYATNGGLKSDVREYTIR